MANSAQDMITRHLGREVEPALERLDLDTLNRFSTVVRRPDVRVRMNRTRAPYGVTLSTSYGTILLDDKLTTVENVYINGTRFNVKENGIDAIEKLVAGVDSAKEVLGETQGRQKKGRKVRARRRKMDDNVELADVQAAAEEEIKAVGIKYDNLFDELGGLMLDSTVTAKDIADELFSYRVSEEDIPHFLTHESQYHLDIISRTYNIPLGSIETNYEFEPVQAGDDFLGRLITSLGETEAEYDANHGVLKINDRLITNLPSVDHNGVFSNGETRYLPYHVGYFADTEGSRVERLRVIDPVQNALDSVKLQYDLTRGDIKFQTILDVTRNLPDFDKHPYGAEILDTLKHKVVLDKSYLSTNSLHSEYENKTDDLGAVTLTMLDDDARGIIDPLGTSNGSNMGVIFYLAEGAEFQPDGTISKGTSEFSKVGQYLNEHYVNRDNFNRNQMSFNAFLTSLDVKELNVAFHEFGMFNAEDAVVMSKTGAEKFNANDPENEHMVAKKVGDKLTESHGNKSVVSLIVDAEMDAADAKDQRLTPAVEFMKANPNVDIVVSPISLASRNNFGVAHEGLNSAEKFDLNLPDGSVVKDGVVKMSYFSLPQTAEHKSKDYGIEGDGRRYSVLFRHALASKVGEDLYKDAFIDENVRAEHIDEAATVFQRLGVSFVDDTKLVTLGNVKTSVDAPITVSATEFTMMTPAVIRTSLTNQMIDNQINIDLGDMKVISPLTEEPIVDDKGRNILPIRVTDDGGIPFRYTEVFKNLSLGNVHELQRSFDHAIGNDFSVLTRKNNILKNIDTMTIKDGAHTDVIVPDPRLKIGDVRVNLDDTRVVAHRDPAIKSGNTISFNNVGGGEPNVMHMQPLIAPMQDKDYDGDTEGVSAYNKLGLTEAQKDEFFARSSVEEQLNHYGEVYLATGGGHFKALATANGVDTSDITFADGKSNAELADVVNNITAQLVDSPTSYGAYALSFENDQTLLDSLGKLADDGIKGNREDMVHHFNYGYSDDENKAIMKALIAKSEWTGLAGAITNNLIAAYGDREFDADLVRTSIDVTHTMTQSVLQMKKNADKLGEIDQGIKDMKAVISGKYSIEASRQKLKEVTSGLIPESGIDKFVDLVAEKQEPGLKFGHGILNNTDMSTTKLSYVTGNSFGKALKNISNDEFGISDDLGAVLAQL